MIELILIDVARRKRGSSESYIETFEYNPTSESDTVATALRYLNGLDELKNNRGEVTDKISWSHSCLQKKCGACSMRVNGKPMLACGAVLSSLGDHIVLEPLKKFPVVCDLLIDKTILYENLKSLKLWLSNDAQLPKDKVFKAQESSKCIQCGCCLDVCPNFYPGGVFFGMSQIGITTKLLLELPKVERDEIVEAFHKHVYAGCGKSLSCKAICPIGLDTEDLLVNSIAMAIWKRRK